MGKRYYRFCESWMDPNGSPYYPWIFRMEGKDVDTFACKFCTSFPNKAYGREKCPWITGLAGGHDGYREDSVRLHDSSKSHQISRTLPQKPKKRKTNLQDQRLEATSARLKKICNNK